MSSEYIVYDSELQLRSLPEQEHLGTLHIALPTLHTVVSSKVKTPEKIIEQSLFNS